MTTVQNPPKDASPDPPRYPYVRVEAPSEECEPVSDLLWDYGALGIEQRDETTLTGPSAGVILIAYFPTEEAASHAAAECPEHHRPQVKHLVGDAWRDAWRVFFKPTRIGQRLVIRPSWETVRTSSNEVVITIDPGRAFGSGIHETTRLVLRELDRRIRGGDTMLDVGCGSGILSIAALRLGAREAHAIDIDLDAQAVTQENARVNHVATQLEVSTTPIASIRQRYSLVVANIEASALIDLAEPIARAVKPGGTLILSGILRDQLTEVASAYPKFDRSGLVPVENEWAALVLKAPSRSG